MKIANDITQLHPLSIREIFAEDPYRVPLYQRAYAWTADEINTLLEDIRDARISNLTRNAGGGERDYYMGALVVNTVRSPDGTVYEVVDGQQRLTTLFILMAVASGILGMTSSVGFIKLRNKLTFEGRDDAQSDLQRLAQDGAKAIDRLATDGIRHAASLIAKAVERGLATRENDTPTGSEPSFGPDDFGYLLDHVRILRSELPQGTDLNHYFEVMNTRGEQLEKHEILKARLVSVLSSPTERDAFSRVWDACAVLDRNIQTQFSPQRGTHSGTSEREAIFGSEWTDYIPQNGTHLFSLLQKVFSSEDDASTIEMSSPPARVSRVSLTDLLGSSTYAPKTFDDKNQEEEPGVYGSITDFPNLLLHVLKIHKHETFSWKIGDNPAAAVVRLEDKYLLDEFPSAKAIDETWVRNFSHMLLRTRFLFDSYVIRTQPTAAGDVEENWVLHRAYQYTDGRRRQLSVRNTFSRNEFLNEDDGFEARAQRRILMLQSMYQVTDSRRSSKYFLFLILSWLSKQEDPNNIDEHSFVRFLEASMRDRLAAIDFQRVLHEGTNVPNFVFNALDYELWRILTVEKEGAAEQFLHRDAVLQLQKTAPQFRFRYRTSVEHFYPAEPAADQGHKQLPASSSNHFGNLCIMTRSENSRRNNLMPKAKAEEFASTGQSLKFQLMASMTTSASDWGPAQIRAHGKSMEAVLTTAVSLSRDEGGE